MPKSSASRILAIIGMLLFVGLIVSLPRIRSLRWEHTKVSSRNQMPLPTPAERDEELAIEQATAVDDSRYAQSIGVRYLRRIPTTKIALEAAFRQRRADAAIMLTASKPLFLNRFAMEPPSSNSITPASRLLATRRPVLSIGLEMRPSDISQLPWISRSTILDFIQGHYVSLQARILKDEISGEWYLHHRPVAGVAKFGSVPLTHHFVSPITETVTDIRGLGVYLHGDPQESNPHSTDQTAVWLFRSRWMKDSTPVTHYDYAFIRVGGSEPEPSQYSVLLTTNNLAQWHCLADTTSSREPLRSSDTSTLGTVHFTEFASDGLHPKTSVTRSVRIKASQDYQLAEIIDHLSQNGFEGAWGDHLHAILEFVSSDRHATQK